MERVTDAKAQREGWRKFIKLHIPTVIDKKIDKTNIKICVLFGH